MMAFSHFPVAPTKLTIPAVVGLSKKLMYRKVARETVMRETPVIFSGNNSGTFKGFIKKLKIRKVARETVMREILVIF